MFLIYHSLNILVLLTAICFYLHPFDPEGPSRTWLLAAHSLLLVSGVASVVQFLLFVPGLTGGLYSFCRPAQLLSIFIMLLGGFFYWVPEVSSFRPVSYPVAILGLVLFVACPLVAYAIFPCRRSWGRGDAQASEGAFSGFRLAPSRGFRAWVRLLREN